MSQIVLVQWNYFKRLKLNGHAGTKFKERQFSTLWIHILNWVAQKMNTTQGLLMIIQVKHFLHHLTSGKVNIVYVEDQIFQIFHTFNVKNVMFGIILNVQNQVMKSFNMLIHLILYVLFAYNNDYLMNYSKFDVWVFQQLEKLENTTKKTKQLGKGQNQKSSKKNDTDMQELIQMFSYLSLKETHQKSKIKLNFENGLDLSCVTDKDYLIWSLNQLKQHLKMQKCQDFSTKIDLIFKIFFNSKEKDFLFNGLCERLGIVKDCLTEEEQTVQIKNIFQQIFDV